METPPPKYYIETWIGKYTEFKCQACHFEWSWYLPRTSKRGLSQGSGRNEPTKSEYWELDNAPSTLYMRSCILMKQTMIQDSLRTFGRKYHKTSHYKQITSNQIIGQLKYRENYGKTKSRTEEAHWLARQWWNMATKENSVTISHLRQTWKLKHDGKHECRLKIAVWLSWSMLARDLTTDFFRDP